MGPIEIGHTRKNRAEEEVSMSTEMKEDPLTVEETQDRKREGRKKEEDRIAQARSLREATGREKIIT